MSGMSGRRQELRLLAMLLLAVLAWDLGGLDLAAAHRLGDVRGFAARDAFWAKTVMHDALRWLEGAAWMLLGADAMRRREAPWGPSRGLRRRALLAGVLTLLLVPALKTFSTTSCPWSLLPFGGTAPWVSHWHWLLSDGGPGRCFPSGHSAGVFAFSSWLWLWRPWRHGLGARWPAACVALLGIGLLASYAQWARGAHFVSHSLWAAWLCAACSWVSLRVPLPRLLTLQARRQARCTARL
ncbi:MAG: phosphatase PAP2 family protein [Roseateles sp.]|uniref:phosphatase PAP2 family protein n=2 Tax=Roseateles sp. TaxID=1971397 RepID=UPI004035FA25